MEVTRLDDAGALGVARASACLRPGGLEITDRAVALARLPRGARVLDVGCGSGATVAHLAGSRGLRATGLDSSAAQVGRARATWPGLDVVVGRAEELPFTDGSFNAVLAECVLSTLTDAGRALREAARVVTPEGRVLLTDLYDRGGGKARSCSGLPSLGPRRAVEALLAGAGLEGETWEDHTGVLARLFWDMAGSAAESAGRAARVRAAIRPSATSPGRRLGYFVCVARVRPGGGRGVNEPGGDGREGSVR